MEAIWYVENDENDVFLLNRAFRKLGLGGAVRHFRTGQEFKDAYAALAVVPAPNDGPRLFLFDLKLDGESGLDILRWIKQQPGAADVPSYIFSSGTVPQEVVASMELDVSAYIFKPISAEGWKLVSEHLAATAGLLQEFSSP